MHLKVRYPLKTEETIAKLKILHDFDMNDDENALPLELQLEIESIQDANDALIEKTKGYEELLISESESNETRTKIIKKMHKINEKIKLADNLTTIMDSGSLENKEMLKKTRLDSFNLEAIEEKISMLPFNAKHMKFVENEQIITKFGNADKIGAMKINETISFEQLNAFDFKELDDFKSFTHSSKLFEILDNNTIM